MAVIKHEDLKTLYRRTFTPEDLEKLQVSSRRLFGCDPFPGLAELIEPGKQNRFLSWSDLDDMTERERKSAYEGTWSPTVHYEHGFVTCLPDRPVVDEESDFYEAMRKVRNTLICAAFVVPSSIFDNALLEQKGNKMHPYLVVAYKVVDEKPVILYYSETPIFADSVADAKQSAFAAAVRADPTVAPSAVKVYAISFQ